LELRGCGITASREDAVPIDLSAIEGPYLRDLLDQPQALNATLTSLNSPKELRFLAAKLNRSEFRRIVLTGMGSSFHALHPANLQLIAQGFTAVMVETSELIHYQRRLFDPSTLIIAVSQSGQSAEIVRLLEVNGRTSALIAVTNMPTSPLARNADATVLTQAGHEFSVSCKTYVAALMALQWLVDILRGGDLDAARRELEDAAPCVQSYLECWKQHVVQFAQRLEGIRHSVVFLVGRGASLAAIGTGALIVKESARFPAEGMSSAAFRHGPWEMLGDETFVLVFAGADVTRDLNIRLVEDIRRQHAQAELVGNNATFSPCRLSAVPSSTQPILEILPVQMMSLALAAHMGREPGRFVLASKVTTRE
jgi:glucosamine--fructose-6-phosphate aminotransferase (isomerizing)